MSSNADVSIVTPRLILRSWRDSDLAPFAEQNADPETMRYLGGVLTRAQSDAYAAAAVLHGSRNGFCKWAVEAPGVAPFIGAVGLTYMKFAADFTPAVEVAWRLNRRFWGKGYATEAALAAVADGFDRVGLREVVAVTSILNKASETVMRRIGMNRAFEFDHPFVPEGDERRRHVLYRLPRGLPKPR